jgi:hypothetical protein
VTDSGAEGSR